MYILYYIKKNLNVLQIYQYSVKIYFGLGSDKFWVRFDNIHTLPTTHWVK
jgi:hypothetical protein